MATAPTIADAPDLSLGVALTRLENGTPIAGQVNGEPVLLSQLDGKLYAVSGTCTHYGGPLAEGLVVDATVRCPWHHACFSLRTGEAIAAPAFAGLDVWDVEIQDDTAFVRRKRPPPSPEPRARRRQHQPDRVLIVGGGAAGFAAADMLRRSGYDTELVMVSADDAPPCDRPNLSKDFLAGTAPESWIPLQGPDFYESHAIDLRLGAEVIGIEPEIGQVRLRGGETLGFDKALLATGAEPIRLRTPGFDQPDVHVLRSLADSRAIIKAAQGASRAVIVGASFIGLEAAAALRSRGLEVHVVAPETIPMARVLGEALGRFVMQLHVEHGVVFHLGQTASAWLDGRLMLSGGEALAADLVVLGVGVKPRIDLAARANLAVDGGVVVDAFLQTSHPAVYAAGDIARYPHGRTGQLIRVEHWVAAQRQGQAAALSMLGEGSPHQTPPFFWSNHYEASIHYVGHADSFDEARIDGSVEDGDATVRYFSGGQLLAAASIGRDQQNLQIELELEQRARA
jgi:NADPH-dependent 2,4-dienoyl-CoA reductase/sulfur reductase-like enzyme/nitrite reductase/ring-hydroxylating ferredoxin subunit